jgi:hypothetical protein
MQCTAVIWLVATIVAEAVPCSGGSKACCILSGTEPEKPRVSSRANDRSWQSSHPPKRPRAQREDQASHYQRQQSVRYDLDEVTGERGADDPAEN